MESNLILSRREEIKKLQDIIISKNDNENFIGDGKEIVHHESVPLKHTFADGIYVRQMDMKKDSIVVGAIHNHLHVWFLLTGKLLVAMENGVEEFISPCYVLSKPGSKRVIYALEDSIFVNIHKNPTNTQDMKKLESEIVSLTFEDYEEYIKNK